jgi:hypothetical protein
LGKKVGPKLASLAKFFIFDIRQSANQKLESGINRISIHALFAEKYAEKKSENSDTPNAPPGPQFRVF